MIYKGTGTAEFIMVQPMNEMDKVYHIELAKMPDEPTFVVVCDYDEDWGYEFYLENNSDYERIKFNIMNAIFECENMEELLYVLGEIFEDGFEDILVDDCDCCGDCRCCNCE